MVEISNETLALLMVGVIVVVIGAMVSLTWMDYPGITGRAPSDTQPGQTRVNISQQVEIELTQDVIDFGTGYIPGNDPVDLMSNATKPAGWDNSTPYNPDNFNLSNRANVDIQVEIVAAVNADTFIGGTSPAMYYARLTNDGGECSGAFSGWNALGTTPADVCTVWNQGNINDWVTVALRLTVPVDTAGFKNNTITFTSSAV